MEWWQLPAGIDCLDKMLQSERDPKVRITIVDSLGYAGESDPSGRESHRAINVIRKAMHDSSPEVRAHVAAAIGSWVAGFYSYADIDEMKKVTEEGKRLLAQMMQDPHTFVKEQAKLEYTIIGGS